MEQLQITINEKPIFTVSEISRNLKKSVEDNFKSIRVRGEVSSFKLHGSGHSYLTLKDDQSVIDAIVWRGTRLDCKLEDGLEVIAQGYLTTYPSRSKYQIIIESAEPSGEGALLKLLMERKSRLEAEGLFARKRPIPGFPKCIGVVSSPTGAVIRDILHRIKERFPTHVILWPVAVQGEGAAEQIARAIEGFNMLPQKPDVIIVARGGGSLEDLWAFNEEIVVRAAASSSIPLISAVGHETDYTLIDFAADLRAPTPTAAAELATPVIRQLFDSVDDHYRKLRTNIFNLFERIKLKINGLARGIPEPHYILDTSLMRFDDWSERLHNSFGSYQEALKQNVIFLSRHIKPPQTLLDQSQQVYGQLHMRFNRAANQHYLFNFQRFEAIAKRLELCAFPEVLKRGFCIVMDGEAPITSVNQLKNPQKLTLHFQDGSVDGTFSQ